MSLITGFFDLEKNTLEEQIKIAKELELKQIAIRQIDGLYVHELDESIIKKTNEILKQNKMSVSIVEIKLDDYHIIGNENMDALEKAILIAEMLHPKVVSMKLPKFDDFDSQSDMLKDWFKQIYQFTKKMKFELSFIYRENYLSGHLAYLTKNVKQIKFNFDGTEFYKNKISTTTIYRLLKNEISTVRISDIDKDFEPFLIGLGVTNIVDILKKLKRDNFNGFIVLDNNLIDYIQNREKSYEKKSIFAFFSKKKSNKDRYLKMDHKLGLDKDSELTLVKLLTAEKTIVEKVIE